MGRSHGRNNLAQLSQNADGSTLRHLKCTGVVRRDMASRVQTVDGVVQGVAVRIHRFAVTESVVHLSAQPTDGLAFAILVQLVVKRVDAELHVIRQVVVDGVTIADDQPVDGHLCLGVQSACVAEMELVQLRLTRMGVAQILAGRAIPKLTQGMGQWQIARVGHVSRQVRNLGDCGRLQVLDPEPACTAATSVALRLRAEAQEPQQNA